MVQQFVDREQEFEFLEKHYNSGSAEFVVVYGRRRIGKTELLQRFLQGKKSLFFLGRAESREETLNRISLAMAEKLGDFALARNPFRSWDAVLDYAYEKTKRERLAFIIDEFPLVINKFPEVLSAVQEKWDQNLKHSKIFMLVCGSSVGMMEEKVLSEKSPLYGRRTGQWKVTGLPLEKLKLFFPKYSDEEIIKAYGVLGTVPGYLVKFDPSLTVMENVERKILSKGEFLYEEPEFLLREEFRDVSNYLSIIGTIAAGGTSYNDIRTKTGLDKSLISKYLHTLERLGIVRREVPVTASQKERLKARGAYALADKFFSFWLRFVYANKEKLETGKKEAVVEEIEKQIGTYLGPVFEDASRQLIGNLHLPLSPTKIGKWWSRDSEIDIACLDENKKEALFFECKWSSVKENEARKIAEGLKEKASLVAWNRKKDHFGLICKKIVGKENLRQEGLLVFDLNDLFGQHR